MSLPEQLSRISVHLAADHAGLSHKDGVRDWLRSLGVVVVDHGACTYNSEDDFPDFISVAAKAVSRAPETARGLIFGGSGQGEAMMANRFMGVRATVYYGGPDEIIMLSREHNDANVLSIGARFVSIDDTKRVIWDWLMTPSARAEKYDRRNKKIEAISKKKCLPKMTLIPSLPAHSESELVEALEQLEGVAESFQVDMVDGVFVDSVAWPFTENDPLTALNLLRNWSSKYVLEVDCMIVNPELYLDRLVEVGVKRVVVHIGSTEKVSDIIAHARKNNYKIGLAITNEKPIDGLISYIPQVDFVQIMGIAEIGKQGEPFDERTLSRVEGLRAMYPDIDIAVDGSVNSVTIPKLIAAGANRLAPGSSVIKASDPKVAYAELSALLVR